MPAWIVVETGPRQGECFPIEEPIFRIGRDPSCAIHLPDPALPLGAAYGQYDGRGYILFVENAASARLNGRSLAAGDRAPWRPGECLELPADITLRLVVEGSPAPARRRVELPGGGLV